MHVAISKETQEARVASLEAEIAHLERNLGPDIDPEKTVKNHIKLLHQYNEAKDATQILIGRLAALKDTTVRQIHKDLELPDSE